MAPVSLPMIAGLRHGGSPGGFVITIRGGPTIYHTGDTDLFSDMALLSRFPRHRRDARLHRRPFHDGTRSRRRSGKAGETADCDSDALRDVSHFDRNTRSICARTETARAKAELRVMKIGETISLRAG